jgi:hypothetical protein
MNIIWVFSELFYAWLRYLCISLRTIGLVWPTRLIFLAMGEVLSFGFNFEVSSPSDRRGSEARIVLLPSRIKRWGFHHIRWVYPLHHVILLIALLCSYKLNTLDVGRSRSMCGVIVVDAESFRSTWHGCDAYMHNHCLGYRHNYSLFYQLLDSNLFTHRIICLHERSL